MEPTASNRPPAPAQHPANRAMETRERLLNVAETLFSERGLAGTSMRDIARDADLQVASLYNHFPGKQALYEAVLNRGVEPVMSMLSAMAIRRREALDVDGIIEQVMNHLASHPHLPRLIQHEALTGGDHLEALAERWIRPLLAVGVAAMEREGSAFERDEYPLAVSAWVHLIFGYFSMAPLMQVIFDEDPLSGEGLERQTVFLRKLARLMVSSERDISLPNHPTSKDDR